MIYLFSSGGGKALFWPKEESEPVEEPVKQQLAFQLPQAAKPQPTKPQPTKSEPAPASKPEKKAEKKQQPVAPKETTKQVKKNATKRYELPAYRASENFIEHTGYALQYNRETHNPDWVAWELTYGEANANNVKRVNDFKGDPMVPQKHRVEAYHYKKSGYDRGHMCPAGDMKWSAKAMSDCFYMTNMCPQNTELNQRWWEHLESACRRWAKQDGVIYICCGPIYKANRKKKTFGTQSVRVRVPDGFFKVVLSLREGKEKAIGFLYSNDDSRQPMNEAAVPVDSVEKVTGFDFFPQLDDKLERRLEAECNLKLWK
ncbi:MAG: DNA/RNA non-specific endonuclease [Bacteroidales bacterium]|nr:DNA/RNA non-specific endonuclease [Bacteroidales bacterium]